MMGSFRHPGPSHSEHMRICDINRKQLAEIIILRECLRVARLALLKVQPGEPEVDEAINKINEVMK